MFYNAQYGFRKEHSTDFASLELVDSVLVEMDKRINQLLYLWIYPKPLTPLIMQYC